MFKAAGTAAIFKREIGRFIDGDQDYPPYPEYYFGMQAIDILEA